MKIKFNVNGKFQPDPFIFEDNGTLYMYVSAMTGKGVEAYKSRDLFGEWEYIGVVAYEEGRNNYWAPSVIKIDGTYYMYMSFDSAHGFQHMHVFKSDSPEGPFKDPVHLYDRFSIDSHMVQTDKGLYLWFAQDDLDREKRGTRVFVDRFIDPTTPEHNPKEVILPTFSEEKFLPQCDESGDWYTIEGAFWFKEGDWQYVMYSGGCFQDETYHVGYASAKSDEADLKKVDFVKHTNGGRFDPVIIRNEFEEGTGHNSVIKYNGEYYAFYHGRDYGDRAEGEFVENRTARICKLIVKDGTITAERYKDKV